MSDITQDFNFLQGVKVVDFTQFEAGTTCTEVLAWFGAEVVKIENPGRGDPGRRLRPGKPDDDPWYFRQFNVNKKSIAINLKSPKGLEIVKDMLKKADITAENMAPGTIERLGLDYELVKKINPRILYCRIKGFASGSPHEKGLAFDMIAQAAGGPISVTGWPDQPPVKPGLSFGDTGTGMLMAATILGALHERNRTGQGRLLEIAMQDAMIHYMRTCFATMMRTGKPAQRRGAKPSAGNNAPAGLYPCKGGGPNDYLYITTSRANPEHYDAADEADRPRGSDRGPALRDRRRARQERRGTRPHHRRMDRAARQARGHGKADRGRRAGRRGVRHDGTAERAEL